MRTKKQTLNRNFQNIGMILLQEYVWKNEGVTDIPFSGYVTLTLAQ